MLRVWLVHDNVVVTGHVVYILHWFIEQTKLFFICLSRQMSYMEGYHHKIETTCANEQWGGGVIIWSSNQPDYESVISLPCLTMGSSSLQHVSLCGQSPSRALLKVIFLSVLSTLCCVSATLAISVYILFKLSINILSDYKLLQLCFQTLRLLNQNFDV